MNYMHTEIFSLARLKFILNHWLHTSTCLLLISFIHSIRHFRIFFSKTINKKIIFYQTNLIALVFTETIRNEMSFRSELFFFRDQNTISVRGVFTSFTIIFFFIEIYENDSDQNGNSVPPKKKFGPKWHFGSYGFYKNKSNQVDLVKYYFFIYGF